MGSTLIGGTAGAFLGSKLGIGKLGGAAGVRCPHFRSPPRSDPNPSRRRKNEIALLKRIFLIGRAVMVVLIVGAVMGCVYLGWMLIC